MRQLSPFRSTAPAKVIGCRKRPGLSPRESPAGTILILLKIRPPARRLAKRRSVARRHLAQSLIQVDRISSRSAQPDARHFRDVTVESNAVVKTAFRNAELFAQRSCRQR